MRTALPPGCGDRAEGAWAVPWGGGRSRLGHTMLGGESINSRAQAATGCLPVGARGGGCVVVSPAGHAFTNQKRKKKGSTGDAFKKRITKEKKGSTGICVKEKRKEEKKKKKGSIGNVFTKIKHRALPGVH